MLRPKRRPRSPANRSLGQQATGTQSATIANGGDANCCVCLCVCVRPVPGCRCTPCCLQLSTTATCWVSMNGPQRPILKPPSTVVLHHRQRVANVWGQRQLVAISISCAQKSLTFAGSPCHGDMSFGSIRNCSKRNFHMIIFIRWNMPTTTRRANRRSNCLYVCPATPALHATLCLLLLLLSI